MASLTKIMIDANGNVLAVCRGINGSSFTSSEGITPLHEAANRSNHLKGGGVVVSPEYDWPLITIEREWKARKSISKFLRIGNGYTFYGWGRVNGNNVYVLWADNNFHYDTGTVIS